MKQKTYEGLYQLFKTEKRRMLLIVLDRLITYAIVLYFGGLLVYLLITQDTRFLWVFMIPAIFLVIVSVMRRVIDQPRPYEVFACKPVLPKEKKGRSMPSRHVASASMISMVTFYLFGIWGIIPMAFTILLALIRVVGGVHFLKDVSVGLACGILAGACLFI